MAAGDSVTSGAVKRLYGAVPEPHTRWMRERFLHLGAGLCVLVAVGFATAEASLDSDALGPAPRSANGEFANFAGDSSHGGFWVRAPFFVRRILGSFQDAPGAAAFVENDGAFLRENAKHSEATVTWIGHATLLVQMDRSTRF